MQDVRSGMLPSESTWDTVETYPGRPQVPIWYKTGPTHDRFEEDDRIGGYSLCWSLQQQENNLLLCSSLPLTHTGQFFPLGPLLQGEFKQTWEKVNTEGLQ